MKEKRFENTGFEKYDYRLNLSLMALKELGVRHYYIKKAEKDGAQIRSLDERFIYLPGLEEALASYVSRYPRSRPSLENLRSYLASYENLEKKVIDFEGLEESGIKDSLKQDPGLLGKLTHEILLSAGFIAANILKDNPDPKKNATCVSVYFARGTIDRTDPIRTESGIILRPGLHASLAGITDYAKRATKGEVRERVIGLYRDYLGVELKIRYRDPRRRTGKSKSRGTKGRRERQKAGPEKKRQKSLKRTAPSGSAGSATAGKKNGGAKYKTSSLTAEAAGQRKMEPVSPEISGSGSGSGFDELSRLLNSAGSCAAELKVSYERLQDDLTGLQKEYEALRTKYLAAQENIKSLKEDLKTRKKTESSGPLSARGIEYFTRKVESLESRLKEAESELNEYRAAEEAAEPVIDPNLVRGWEYWEEALYTGRESIGVIRRLRNRIRPIFRQGADCVSAFQIAYHLLQMGDDGLKDVSMEMLSQLREDFPELNPELMVPEQKAG